MLPFAVGCALVNVDFSSLTGSLGSIGDLSSLTSGLGDLSSLARGLGDLSSLPSGLGDLSSLVSGLGDLSSLAGGLGDQLVVALHGVHRGEESIFIAQGVEEVFAA